MEKALFHRPPPRFVYAFQLALALVITYWLALLFDWERPKWAAFAVATIAMPHVGMSLARAAQRILGTALGASMAILIIALFPQDRWLFILALSLWMAACTYMMGFSQRSYMWHCAGFICAIIATTAANVQGNSFMLAIDRGLETGLGVVVYTLVALLIWRVKPESDPQAQTVPELFFPDWDQVIAAVRVFIAYWLAFLCVVYIPAFPTGLAFLAPLAPFVMVIGATPQVPVKALRLPIVMGLLLASILYMLVMPKLEGFGALAVLIFLFGFATAYRFYAPQETLARLFILAIFAALTGVNNDQAYTFAAVSNNVLIFTFVLVILHITASVPVRARPESQFLGLLERFKVSAHCLAYPHPPRNVLERWRRGYHRHEVTTIPAKLKAWMPRLTPCLSEETKADVDSLLQTIAECQSELLRSETESGSIKKLSEVYNGIDWAAWPRPGF